MALPPMSLNFWFTWSRLPPVFFKALFILSSDGALYSVFAALTKSTIPSAASAAVPAILPRVAPSLPSFDPDAAAAAPSVDAASSRVEADAVRADTENEASVAFMVWYAVMNLAAAATPSNATPVRPTTVRFTARKDGGSLPMKSSRPVAICTSPRKKSDSPPDELRMIVSIAPPSFSISPARLFCWIAAVEAA